tara:strand:- start:831 stop:1832 length:1002 start_codon:yes stop_codon:yes gene_type:complete
MADEIVDTAPLIDDDAPITPSGADAEVKPDAKPDAVPDTGKPDAPAKSDAPVDVKPDAKPAGKTDAKAEPTAWGEDWRDKVAKGDAKKLSRLGRYASPEAVVDALISAQNRISSGDLKPILKKDATEAQVKEYREALGIPETPDKYDLGEVLPATADKSMIDDYLKTAHATNQTPEQVKASIAAYYSMVEKAGANRAAQDSEITSKSEDSLREEWGVNYKRNLTLISSFLDNAPEGLKDQFLKGRLGDGTPIASSPEALRWLLQIELERNPTATVTPGAGGNLAKSVEDERNEILKFMSTNRNAYNKDEKMQSRLRSLNAAIAREEEKSKKAA